MCGEHLLASPLFALRPGSSPHVRGTPQSPVRTCASAGIIPACAGNTPAKRERLRLKGDHPRMCGEHLPPSFPWPCEQGSSPHVRGTPTSANSGRRRDGIIPACAGNTMPARSHSPSHRDHPRMCGEHPDGAAYVAACEGSSPHVRGTPSACSSTAIVSGIIPACAGNTYSDP